MKIDKPHYSCYYCNCLKVRLTKLYLLLLDDTLRSVLYKSFPASKHINYVKTSLRDKKKYLKYQDLCNNVVCDYACAAAMANRQEWLYHTLT